MKERKVAVSGSRPGGWLPGTECETKPRTGIAEPHRVVEVQAVEDRPEQVKWLAALSSQEGQWFTTKDPMLFSIYRKEPEWIQQYEAIIGTTDAATAAKFRFGFDDTFQAGPIIDSGFAYLDGNCPYGTAAGGSTSSEGSTVIIQAVVLPGDKRMARFFFLAGQLMKISGRNGSQKSSVMPGQYIEVVDELPKDAVPIPSNPADPLFKFVTEVKAIATSLQSN